MQRGIAIREAPPEKAGEIADLIVRLKRLNGEFDALLSPAEDLEQQARDYVRAALGERKKLVLIAEREAKVLAVLIGEVRRRSFYRPSSEGVISDFYVLPEYRRTGIGARLLAEAAKRLRAMGAELLTAEFPSQNLIAVNFYRKHGFRALVNIYAAPLEDRSGHEKP
jgi:ribosomal protein S18 acetylase RimI-like enzyme